MNPPPNEKQEHPSRVVATAWQVYSGRLHRFLIHQLQVRGSPLLADDIAQEVYLRLLRFKNVDLIRHPQAYLYQIARNVLADRLEIEGHLHERVVVDSTIIEKSQDCSDDSADSDTLFLYPQSTATSDILSEDIAAEVERDRELEYLLSQLPKMHRAALTMCKCEGKSYSETAKELHISTHTVKKYVHQALTQCRLIWLKMR